MALAGKELTLYSLESAPKSGRKRVRTRFWYVAVNCLRIYYLSAYHPYD
jgi:hypothetical protein